MSFDDLYVHEEGRIKEWSPLPFGKKSCSMARRIVSTVLTLFVIYAISTYMLFIYTNNAIENISTTVDINPLAERWLPYDTTGFIVFGIILVIASIIAIGFFAMKRERAAVMVLFVVIIIFAAFFTYIVLSDALAATSVLFTSPGDPYYTRYYVGVELVREIGAPELYYYWFMVVASFVVSISFFVFIISGYIMNKRFDTAASKKTFSVKQSKTIEFTCTSIDGKDICKFKP